MDMEQKRLLIEDLFATLQASGYENLSEGTVRRTEKSGCDGETCGKICSGIPRDDAGTPDSNLRRLARTAPGRYERQTIRTSVKLF